MSHLRLTHRALWKHWHKYTQWWEPVPCDLSPLLNDVINIEQEGPYHPTIIFFSCKMACLAVIMPGICIAFDFFTHLPLYSPSPSYIPDSLINGCCISAVCSGVNDPMLHCTWARVKYVPPGGGWEKGSGRTTLALPWPTDNTALFETQTSRCSKNIRLCECSHFTSYGLKEVC